MDKPIEAHLAAAHHLLRYIKAAPGKGLFFPAVSTLQLMSFSNSDWGACPDSRKSIFGYSVILGDALISWKLKKQSNVSKSSSEAEYRALALLTCEIQWLLYLLHDLFISHPSPALLFCDNQSAIQLAYNPIYYERTKHIEIDCHIIREKIQQGIITLLPVTSSNQLADCFTKPLPLSQFHASTSKLGLHNLYAPA